MPEQPDRPDPAGGPTPHDPNPAPVPTPPADPAVGSVSPWQGPEVFNSAAVAAGAGMRVESVELLAVARALGEHAGQVAAAAGLRVEPRAAGHPNAASALTDLADRFHATLAALDADRGAAVGNLEASARIYRAVEVRARDDLLNTLGHSPAGTRTTPSGPAFPAPGPGR